MSVIVTTIKNPFEPDTNAIQVVEWSEGLSAGDFSLPIKPGTEVVFALNGVTVLADSIIADGDRLAVVVKVEGTFAAAVAGWAAGLTAGGAAIGGMSAAYAVGVGTALAYGTAYVATLAAIGYASSLVISAITPGADTAPTYDTSNEFDWGNVTPSYIEGVRIPLLYGTVRTSGHILQQYVGVGGLNIDGDLNKEYLSVLLGICDHEVDEITDIQIDGQDIDDFTSVETDYRLGALTETTAIDGFSEIRTQTSVNVLLDREEGGDHLPVTRTTYGYAVEKIWVSLVWPGGLYYTGADGRRGSLGATYAVAYRLVGSSTWIEATYPDPEAGNIGLTCAHIIEKSADPVRRVIPLDNLTPGQYEVQVFRDDYPSAKTTFISDFYFESFTEIRKQELIYPGLAKYSIKALATNQLSGGVPSFSCLVSKNFVDIEGGSKPATNPAWICYDLLQSKSDRPILYDEFYEWAAYCSEQIDGEDRFSCSTLLTSGSWWENIQNVARIGRATVIIRGSSYGVFCDKPESIVSHMFTSGNIIDGSFSKQYLPQKDRANYVEIEYTDPDKEDTRQVVSIYDEDYLADSTQKKTTVSFAATFPRAQAVRDGAFLVNSNNYIKEMVSFDADVYSFACVVGDLFYFREEMIDYESSDTGGRIVSATATTVTLDHEVTIGSGSHKILVESQDGTFTERTVTAAVGPVVTVSSAWDEIPQKYDQFIFGSADTYDKLYRLISCETASDQTRTLIGLEYNDIIYTDTELIVEDVDRNDWANNMPIAVNVMVVEGWAYTTDKSIKTTLQASWGTSYARPTTKWDVYVKESDGGENQRVASGGQETFCRIDNYTFEIGSTYTVMVVAAGYVATDLGNNTASLTILGKDSTPSDVTGFTATWDSIRRTIVFGWAHITDPDLDKYIIKSGADYDTGVTVVETVSNSSGLGFTGIASGSFPFGIKALDKTGNSSENATYYTLSIDTSSTELITPTGLVWTSDSNIGTDGTDVIMIYADWTANSAEDFDHFVLQVEDDFTGKVTQFFSVKNEYQFQALPNRSYTIAVAAADKGNNTTAFSAGVTHTTCSDALAPNAATGLSAGGTFTNILLSWTHSGEADLNHFDVYRHTSDASGSSSLVGTASASYTNTGMYVDTPPTGSTYYYWVKSVDSSGNESEFSAVSSAMAPGVDVSIGPGSITETEIADDAIKTPHLSASIILAEHVYGRQFGADQIIAGSITSNEITVSSLSSLTAYVGTLTGGLLRNSTGTTYLNLSNGTMSLGGLLIFNGTTLTINSSATIAGSTASTVVSNASSGATFTSSDAGNLATKDTVSDSYITSLSGSKITTGTITGSSSNSYWNLNTNIMYFTSSGKLCFGSTSNYIYGDSNNVKITGGSNSLYVGSTGINLACISTYGLQGSGKYVVFSALSGDATFQATSGDVKFTAKAAGNIYFSHLGAYTAYLSAGGFVPVTNNSILLGSSSQYWHKCYSSAFYDSGGLLQDVQDDLAVMAEFKPRKKISIDPETGKKSISEKTEIDTETELEYIDLLSLPDFMTNIQELRTKLKEENGDLLTDQDIEDLIEDQDEAGWMLCRNIAAFNDCTSGAVRQLDGEMISMCESFAARITELEKKINNKEYLQCPTEM